MAVDLGSIGRVTGPDPVQWTSQDALLYALGVGAGSADPTEELQFTTENTEGKAQQVLPTFPVVLGTQVPMPSYGEVDRRRTVHATQGLVVHRPLTPDGLAMLTRSIDAVHDKDSGALIHVSSILTDVSGELLAEQRTGIFVRGAGGYGGDRGPGSTWTLPERHPDAVIEQRVPLDQALLYRLSGDRNPLHSDPAFAGIAGYPRPILHGLCTYGYVGRALLGLVSNDPARFRRMDVRFSAPVFPGDTLRIEVWRGTAPGSAAKFRCMVQDRVVLDQGVTELDGWADS